MERTRLLLAEDNLHYLDALRTLLVRRYQIVGVAHDGLELIEMARFLPADVLVSDVAMPGMNGFEVAGHVRAILPLLRIVFISSHKQHEYVRRAIELGALGYVTKNRALTDLPKAIDCAVRGERFFSELLDSAPVQEHDQRTAP